MKEKIKKVVNKKTAISTVLLLCVIFAAAALALYNNAKFDLQAINFPSYQTTTATTTTTTTTRSAVATTTTTKVAILTQTTTAITATTATTPTTQTTQTTQTTIPQSFVTLEIKSWGYNPNVITISKGSTATWTNKDGEVHTVTSAGNFDSGDIAAGGSWQYTFNAVGTYEYSCKYHPSLTGKVIVN
jgi:plastocyanin